MKHLKQNLKESYSNETNLQKKANKVERKVIELAKESFALKDEAERARKMEEQ